MLYEDFYFSDHSLWLIISGDFSHILHIQPAKLYKLKRLTRIEVMNNDPSGCTFTLVRLSISSNVIRALMFCPIFSLKVSEADLK